MRSRIAGRIEYRSAVSTQCLSQSSSARGARSSAPIRGDGILLALFGLLLPASLATGQQARPAAEELFPETTVLFLQIQNVRELAEDFMSTNMGNLMKQEKIAPLAEELWGQAKEAYAEVQDEVGVSLEDMQSLPTGEIRFAAIAPLRADIQFAMLMDIDPESDTFKNMERVGRERGELEGATFEDEETADVKFTTVARPDGEGQFVYFIKDGTFVITTDKALSQQIVDRWVGREVEKIRPLKDNRKFVTIMNRCRGTKEVPPEARMYMDPIEFFRASTRGDVGTQAALNFLPILGLDGLLGVGGSVIFDEQGFESVTHLHLMLANPRAGILEMLALKPGKYQPQLWVSDQAVSYVSTSWDVNKVYAELGKMVDLFTSEGEFERQVETNVNERLELNLKDDILAAMDGRFTVTSWVEPPARLNSQVNAIGLGLSDPEKAEEIIRQLIQRAIDARGDQEDAEPPVIEEKYKGITIWTAPVPEDRRERIRQRREEGEMQFEIRIPEPGFAIIDGSLVAADSVSFIKFAIDTYKGENPPLVDDPSFKQVSRQMTNLLGTDMPAAIFYSQPGPMMESMLNLAKGDDVKGALERGGEENRFVKNFQRALEDNPLPDWEEIRDFFASSGGFITSDDSGYHALLFNLKSAGAKASK
ncbi:MAG: DUF3352 domain-containing protein [Planctomycetota bacterium]